MAHYPTLSASTYLNMVSSPALLGNPKIKTQHLLGGSRYEKLSEGYVIGYHQVRAMHQVYRDKTCTEVKLVATGHATNEFYYRRGEGGSWKFAGLKPGLRFNEGEFEKVFAV